MSTTINYKGNTIATLDNETKKLTTAGMWLEDDIEIIDTGVSGIVYQDEDGTIVLSDTGAQGITLNDYFNHKISGDISYNGTSLSYISLGENPKLGNVYMPNLTTFNESPYCFRKALEMETFSAPELTRMHGNTGFLYGNTKLKTVYLPKLETLAYNDSFVEGCTSLVDINIKNINDTGMASFRNCTSLKTIVLPKVTKLYTSAFQNDSSLECVDALISDYIGTSVFNGCTKLNTLIIRKTNSVATLQNINSFTNTPFASGGSGGRIYVPTALLESYKTATNWSTLNDYGTVTWIQIEGSEYEHYYADGTEVTS